MARGANIIVTADPQGTFEEGLIVGTPKPGTAMEVVAATAYTGGRPSYQAVTRADGAIGSICILLEDRLQGKLATDAYVNGTRGFLYYPVQGEDLNLLVGDVVGTGDIVTIGDLYGVTQTTGKWKKNSSFASAPMQAQETLAALTADTLVWFKFLGPQA